MVPPYRRCTLVLFFASLCLQKTITSLAVGSQPNLTRSPADATLWRTAICKSITSFLSKSGALRTRKHAPYKEKLFSLMFWWFNVEVTPVLIPNTEVKLYSADDTRKGESR